MIAKISRGADTVGLLRYLLGPGRANEHSDPHLIASWDGDPAALEPAVLDGRPQVRGLAALLEQPLEALQRLHERTVWHCSLRNAPGDRPLSDQEWAEAARRVLDRVGLAPSGDLDGCRWIAARHGEDHVHLLVTLARQDGRPARTPNDYRRAGEACQQLERHFGLTPTPARDSTAVQRPSRPEVEKAVRAGREESTRETLRREVRIASLAALDPQVFLDELRRSGLVVKARYSIQDPGRLTGYAVAWPGDHAPGGRPVWFSGSTLAPDLSLPRLQQRWDGTSGAVMVSDPSRPSGPAGRTDWTRLITQLSKIGAEGGVTALTQATASVLIAAARVVEGARGGPLTRTATRASGDLGRAATGASSPSAADRMMLAAAHIVLRASRHERPRRSELALLEHALLDVLGVVASRPSLARPTRDQTEPGEVVLDRDEPRAMGHHQSFGEVRMRLGHGVPRSTTSLGVENAPAQRLGPRLHR